jgi:histidyl-tRNA synthetase
VFQLPRGTRDFTPEEMKKHRYVEENLVSTFRSFGYEEIQTPTFETLELFTAKSGETIINELYSFKDKSGRELALRPELTAPVMRFYVDKLQMKPKPLKLYYFGKCFRYDRPQKGRYREFQQIGCELIGASTPEALAELIALAYYAIKNAGVKNIDLRIGNLDYLEQQLTETIPNDVDLSIYYPGGSADIYRLIDKEDYDELENLFNKAGVPQRKKENFMDFLNSGSTKELGYFISKEEREPYEEIIRLLKKFGVDKVQVGMKIARGLDYYKGFVFEIDAPILGAEKQLCGGGQYNLIPLFGGRDIPTAGFAIGFDRTILALEEEGLNFPSIETDVYVIPADKKMISKSIEIAQRLRKEGISTDLDLLRRGICKKSLKYADYKNSKKVILVGLSNVDKDSVTIKDMETGNQKVVEIINIVAELKNK